MLLAEELSDEEAALLILADELSDDDLLLFLLAVEEDAEGESQKQYPRLNLASLRARSEGLF